MANHQPTYRYHKARDCAVVTIDGKDHYLGRFDSQESWEKYHRLIADRLACPVKTAIHSKVAGHLSVGELILSYWQFVISYYLKGGYPTSEQDSIRQALRFVRRAYGSIPIKDFSPLKLKAVRQTMVEHRVTRKVKVQDPGTGEFRLEDRVLRRSLARTLINKHIGRIKQMFRWAVENELVHPSVYHGLQAVKGLQRGRSEARETEPVRPAPEPLIQAVHPFVSRQVWAMIQLQLFTGMRPGEVCAMRASDIDMAGSIWVYRPADHKTQHHGLHREIYIGPKGQEVVRLFLKEANEAFLFSPSEAREEQFQRMRATRKTKVQPSQACRRKAKAKRLPGGKYDVASYRRAIAYACVRAFPLPEELGPSRKETQVAWQARLTEEEKMKVQAWRRQHCWHPHQLRHNAASKLRKEFGIELARIILGHSSAFTTEIYAEADRQKAVESIGRIG